MPKPKKLRPRAKSAIATRICTYLNERFDGNVMKAAVAIDCPYDPLRNMALGLAVKPNVTVIQKLALHSGESIDWWLA